MVPTKKEACLTSVHALKYPSIPNHQKEKKKNYKPISSLPVKTNLRSTETNNPKNLSKSHLPSPAT